MRSVKRESRRTLVEDEEDVLISVVGVRAPLEGVSGVGCVGVEGVVRGRVTGQSKEGS